MMRMMLRMLMILITKDEEDVNDSGGNRDNFWKYWYTM